MNLIMIGMRGAGKSNVSRRLAVLCKRPVLSTDLLIQYDNGGRSVADIVDNEKRGWRAFRDMEYDVVKKVSALDGAIVDCGGGVIVDIDDNGNEYFSKRKVDRLKQNGTVVWLRGDIKTLAQKVKKTEARPTLDQQRSAEDVMRRRVPFYEKAADVILTIDGRRRADIAEEIMARFPDL